MGERVRRIPPFGKKKKSVRSYYVTFNILSVYNIYEKNTKSPRKYYT